MLALTNLRSYKLLIPLLCDWSSLEILDVDWLQHIVGCTGTTVPPRLGCVALRDKNMADASVNCFSLAY